MTIKKLLLDFVRTHVRECIRSMLQGESQHNSPCVMSYDDM